VSGLRILHVYPKDDYFTGAAIQLRELAQQLARRGHEVVVATRPSAHWARLCRQEGLAHYGVPMTSEVDLASAWRLARILKTHRIGVVHAHKGKGRTLALMAGLLVRIPVLILNRGVSFPLDRFQRLGYTTRRVTAVIAVCESIKASLVRSGVDPGKIEVIYSGTDTTRFHPGVDGAAVRRGLGFTPADFVITQIGVRSWKGNDDVMDAMVAVAAAAPAARLLIVGARNPDSLYELARRRRLDGRVCVVGYREDVPEILAASDCCVDASYAGLGLTGTLREALAVGTPVVATDLEGNPELVTHGVTGLLVPPRRADALARALLEILADRPAACTMALEGQRRVQARFSTAVKVERTEALYRRLLAEASAQQPAGHETRGHDAGAALE
jgi:glycosyltransferase involved in cell wall biosynthesis